MQFKAEIGLALVNGVTPLFLYGLVELAKHAETRETLLDAIAAAECDLYGGKPHADG